MFIRTWINTTYTTIHYCLLEQLYNLTRDNIYDILNKLKFIKIIVWNYEY